jgi:hypothetical protein
VFGPSLLKEVGTELGAGYLRGDRQDGNATALTIMESIDEMEIARPAASCTDRKFARNLRFAPGCEGGDLFVPNHHPVDAVVSSDGVGKSVERVTSDSVDTLYSSSQECLDDYIGDLDQYLLSEHLSLDAILRSNGYTIAYLPQWQRFNLQKMIRRMSAIRPSLRRLTPVSLVPITLKDLIKLSTFIVSRFQFSASYLSVRMRGVHYGGNHY